jgi:hypothetical protein
MLAQKIALGTDECGALAVGTDFSRLVDFIAPDGGVGI